MSASGGGDIAEDVADALEKAASLQWASDFRLLIHFLDAPPHGSAYHDLDERYDARLDDNTDIARIVCSMASNRIDYVMVRCGGGEEQRYTEKFARFCKDAYDSARRSMEAKHVLGHLPRFKAFSLDTSDASQFLAVILQVNEFLAGGYSTVSTSRCRGISQKRIRLVMVVGTGSGVWVARACIFVECKNVPCL
jgi:hypothetical protein